MQANFFARDKYFPDDKEERSIYIIILTTPKGKYDFKFGQSISNAAMIPTEYDVLSCLTKYNPGEFEDFCSEYGYEEDSRAAEKIYKSVKDEYKNITRIFTPEQIEQMQEIQ